MTGFAIGGWDISAQTLIIGLLTGLTYAVLAAGLVLIYRATGVINFAHGQLGALGAAVLAKLVLDEGWNYWVAFALMLVLGGVLGGLLELTIVRRLFRAPRLVLLVATIGLSQLLLVGQLLIPAPKHAGPFPTPIHRHLHIGSLLLNGSDFMVVAFVPAVIALLWFLLNRTPYGLAVRAAADEADRAELAGISTKRVSTIVWVAAGVLATLTAILIDPIRNVAVGAPSAAVGPSLLLRALTAGLFGSLVSVPAALVGGLVVGVVEAVLFANVANPGAVDAALFVGLLVLVVFRRRSLRSESGSWSLGPKVRSVPTALAGRWWGRNFNTLVAVAGIAAAALLPLVVRSASHAYLFSTVAIYALVGLSVTILTGWCGQLSLGQFAFTGLGAFVAAGLEARGLGFGVCIAYATLSGVLAALIIGLPALRVPGLFLAVTTLGFAVAAPNWLFQQSVFVGSATVGTFERGSVLGIGLGSQRVYYWFCLALVVACAYLLARLRRTGLGRGIVATKDNELAASAYGLSPSTVKLIAFGLSGGLAALAGALLAALRVQYDPLAFSPDVSLQVVSMTIIGGLGSIGGTILGALYVVGLPALFGNDATVGLLTSGAGLLVLLLYLPDGLVGIWFRARDKVLQRLPVSDAGPTKAPRVPTTRLRPEAAVEPAAEPGGTPLLAARDVRVSFGGRHALCDVSLAVGLGEVVGLIGTNGSGKSTLLNVISGFQTSSGTIELDGSDIGSLGPHERAAAGVSRVFQDARLFPGLTVSETIKVACESRDRSELVPSLLGLPPSRRSEAEKSATAGDCIDMLGLNRYAHRFVSELSTGTRRIVELACLLAQGGRLLLLDEPTAGVAQREAEAFGPLINSIRAQLGASLLIIEHDIPLVMSISDRVYCLASGQVIAEGRPDQVRSDPAVIAAYLGADERAISRSGRAGSRSHELVAGDLTTLTRQLLIAAAGEHQIPGRHRMTKAQLVEAIEDRRSSPRVLVTSAAAPNREGEQ